MYAGTYFGIPVKIHWTFGYIIFYIIYSGYQDNLGLQGMLWFGLFILSLFLCVILHEYGHALTARRYGVHTADIILTPLGGIARLTKMPDKPVQELIVALAGPLVNVIIAGLLFVGLYFGFEYNPFIIDVDNAYNFTGNPGGFFGMLMLTNIALVVFNLLPVFPMDGGRVLRSLIAMKASKVRATLIAARIGQLFSLFFVGYGIYSGNLMLALIGLFIFQSAYMEYRYTKADNLMQSSIVENLGYAEYDTFQSDDLIINCKELMKYSDQPFFPILSNEVVIGSVSRDDIIQSDLLYRPVSELSMMPVPQLPSDTNWMTCYQIFSKDQADVILLNKDGAKPTLLDKWIFYQQLENKKLIKKGKL